VGLRLSGVLKEPYITHKELYIIPKRDLPTLALRRVASASGSGEEEKGGEGAGRERTGEVVKKAPTVTTVMMTCTCRPRSIWVGDGWGRSRLAGAIRPCSGMPNEPYITYKGPNEPYITYKGALYHI
jgi:hypothetical protein